MPPPAFAFGEPGTWLWTLAALLLSGLFSMLRMALKRSSRGRLLRRVASESQRKRILPLLRRADSLATSASAFKTACDLTFTVGVLSLLVGAVGGGSIGPETLLATLGIAVPVLLLVAEVLPGVFVRTQGDRLLVAFLPAFHVLQLPFAAVVWVLEATSRAVRRAFGMPDSSGVTRELVEDLREVIEESEREGDLCESEREIIENVMEFHDVDAAEIMTPRTEIVAVEVDEGLRAAVEAVAQSGHSRIPVFEKNLDSVIGSVLARDVILHAARGTLESTHLRELLRPTKFIPETKLVSQLLSEFRLEKQKMAIVLDEYGGTSGLVTMGDILTEIVGDIQDEFDLDAQASFQRLPDGAFDVDASARISEVNEELGLELSEEEDYETLGGYVLAVLGHFPKDGETFERDFAEFTVTESSDRRVLRVRVRPLAGARGPSEPE